MVHNRSHAALEWAAVSAVYVLATSAVTWPLATALGTAVNDFGDPLLNSWTLAWVAHSLASDPVSLFNAPIFHPEHATLAYSEPLILPAILVSPVWWLTGNAVLCHNLTLLSGYIVSGLMVYGLVRHITHVRTAALLAGLAFCVYPYRADHLPRVQLQLTYCMPLALWLLHRWLDRQTPARAAAVGLATGGQVLCCLYYGIYFATCLVPIAIGLGWARRVPFRRAVAHALVAVVCLLLTTAWLAPPFLEARHIVGERPVGEIVASGARPSDYLHAHPRQVLHGDPRHPGEGELRLFPGWTLPLAAAGSLMPLTSGAAVYGAVAVLAFDLSRGLSGPTYSALYNVAFPFRGLRVPARAGMLVGLLMSVLLGLTVARLVRCRTWPRLGGALVVAIAAGLVAESAMRPVALSFVPSGVPPVYSWLAAQPPGVVVEYPVGPVEGRIGPQDTTYMLAQTKHWRPLLNGYSGFAPPSYVQLVETMREEFPGEAALALLRERGVDYLIVHERYFGRRNFRADAQTLDRSADVRFVAALLDGEGRESRVYRVVR